MMTETAQQEAVRITHTLCFSAAVRKRSSKRLVEEISLHQIDVDALEELDLFLFLHAFGDHAHIQLVGHFCHIGDNDAVAPGAGVAVDEGFVQLQHIAKRCLPGVRMMR